MRSRDKILTNLENIYRQAYDRAQEAEDGGRMIDLDASYQREQLLLEVLMDIRDAIHTVGDAPDEFPVEVVHFPSVDSLQDPELT